MNIIPLKNIIVLVWYTNLYTYMEYVCELYALRFTIGKY